MIQIFALLGLIGLLGGDSTGVSLSGTVTDKNGSPISGVRVQVATAGPKVGEGLYCPSCYRDCANGRRRTRRATLPLPASNPRLKFTLMATRAGKKTLQTKFVDPLRRKHTPGARTAQPSCRRRERCTCKSWTREAGPSRAPSYIPAVPKERTGEWSGRVDGVDPAASDSDGYVQVEFPKGYEAVDLDITANGFARHLGGEEQDRRGQGGTRLCYRAARAGGSKTGS